MPPLAAAFLLLVTLFGCTAAVLMLPRPLNVIAPFSALAFLAVVSFALFVLAALLLPVAAIVTGGIVAALMALMIRGRAEGKRVDILTAEKESIMTRLRDREAKVALLEREILDLQTDTYWTGITLPMLEHVRVRLRKLIVFLDKGEHHANRLLRPGHDFPNAESPAR